MSEKTQEEWLQEVRDGFARLEKLDEALKRIRALKREWAAADAAKSKLTPPAAADTTQNAVVSLDDDDDGPATTGQEGE